MLAVRSARLEVVRPVADPQTGGTERMQRADVDGIALEY
jgi:hypothetical protein